MDNLSLGIRLVIVLPTVFFLISQILKYTLKTRSKKEVGDRNLPSSNPVFSWIGHRTDRQFRWEFSIDSAILSMANGLILVFELGRTEYGIVLLIFGVIISLAGFVAIESDSDSGSTFVSLLLYVLFLSEMLYFASFGASYNLLGFVVLPWHIFLVPSIATITIIIVALLAARKPKASAG